MSKHLIKALPLIVLLAGCQSITSSSTTGEAFVSSNDPAAVGHEHFSRGDYALAEQHFRKAVEQQPSDAPSWVGLAASYDRLGRFDLADRAYDKATQLSGNSFEILNNRGFSYMLRGNTSQAAVMFNRAKGMRPNDPVVSNNLRLLQTAQVRS